MTQEPPMQRLIEWDDIEETIHKAAIAFINDHSDDPSIEYRHIEDSDTGFVYSIHVVNDDRFKYRGCGYIVYIMLSMPDDALKVPLPPKAQLDSVESSAERKFTALYGEPDILYVYSDYFAKTWDCYSWYVHVTILHSYDEYTCLILYIANE